MPSSSTPILLFISIFLTCVFINEPFLTCKIVKKLRWVTYFLSSILIFCFWKDFDCGDYFTIFVFLFIYFCISNLI